MKTVAWLLCAVLPVRALAQGWGSGIDVRLNDPATEGTRITQGETTVASAGGRICVGWNEAFEGSIPLRHGFAQDAARVSRSPTRPKPIPGAYVKDLVRQV